MEVEKVVEHEDGSATFHFDMSEDEKDIILEIGLRALLISTALGISIDQLWGRLKDMMEEHN